MAEFLRLWGVPMLQAVLEDISNPLVCGGGPVLPRPSEVVLPGPQEVRPGHQEDPEEVHGPSPKCGSVEGAPPQRPERQGHPKHGPCLGEGGGFHGSIPPQIRGRPGEGALRLARELEHMG